MKRPAKSEFELEPSILLQAKLDLLFSKDMYYVKEMNHGKVLKTGTNVEKFQPEHRFFLVLLLLLFVF